MKVIFGYEDHQFEVEGTFTPGGPATHEDQGYGAEFEVESCLRDGSPVCDVEICTLVEDDGWYDVLVEAAEEVWVEEEYDDLDDPMDGDHESALASAGFGTDEDYGSYSDFDDREPVGCREDVDGTDCYESGEPETCLGDEYDSCFYEG